MSNRASGTGFSFSIMLAGGFLASVTTLASAQTAGAGSHDFRYEFTPYLWAAGLDGNTGIGPATTATSAEFDDILERLDLGLMGTFEARPERRWGFLFDGMYIKLSNSEPIAAGLVDAEITQQMYTAAATYRVAEGRTPVDVLGGLRYNRLKTELDIGSRSVSATEDWVDPFIGARIQIPLSERWTLMGYADIGGFGVGSDNTWQLAGGVNYAFSRNITGKFGYRHLKVDYDKNDFRYDMATSGVYVGVGFRF